MANKVIYHIAVGFRGSIDVGSYNVARTVVNVLYPDAFMFGFPPFLDRIDMPRTSTLFTVTWDDQKGKTQAQFEGHVERQLPLLKALKSINQLMDAYKLVRLGHAEGLHLRRIGTGDTLFHTCFIEGTFKPFDVNRRMPGGESPVDRLETQKLANPHIEGNTVPIARRYLNCFELFEHGYYSEAIIIAHGILDDLSQGIVEDALEEKGVSVGEDGRDLILRGITGGRLKTFLGPLLRVLHGKELKDIWFAGPDALGFLNKKRNAIAHNGFLATRAEAAFAIFASIKIVAALHHAGILQAEFPRGMFRTARNMAAWSIPDRPEWVSRPGEEDQDPFDPTYV
ncbi:hypothetical protein J2857_000541 [Neorhizobium galegae]|uniref:hypothetical protein n=1 Tax=Neorhizobium galegae TaxID=399 RepID=UPI001AE6F9D3|nr:hypothetical protein [Neorhizobium galegae]MBP2557790.1 hypothetical protein [Neorhizobium galegae]